MKDQLRLLVIQLSPILRGVSPWALVLLSISAIIIGMLLPASAQNAGRGRAALYNHNSDTDIVVYDVPLVGHYALATAYQRSASPVRNGPAPRLELPRLDIDLGHIVGTQAAEHTLVIRNAGRGLLRITRLYTTCPCLTAWLTSGAIPPAHAALLTIRLEATGQATGRAPVTVRRGVFIESNDPVWPQASIWVEATLSEAC